MKFLRLFVIITVVLSYSSVVQAAVSDDLVSYWDFNENTGITAADSENNNDGILANTNNLLDKGVTWNNLDSIEGSSVEFDGSGGDNYNTIIVSDDSSLDFDTTTDFAISVWIKANSSTSDNFIQVVGKNSGYGTKAYNMVIDNGSDDKLRMLIDWDASRVVETFSGSPDLLDDQWHNLVLNFDRDGNCIGYVDNQDIGLIDISSSNGNDISNNIDLWIGNLESTNGDRFVGLIDELAIWSRNLTVSEINTIYDNGINGLNLLHVDNGVPEYTAWVYYILLFLSFFLIYKKLPKLRKL